jgi:hypothetical protein
MKSDAQNTAAGTQQPQLSPSPPNAKIIWSQAAQYSVLVAFGLYMIGFVVWHAYLVAAGEHFGGALALGLVRVSGCECLHCD